MTGLKLTEARRKALAVVVDGDKTARPVRVSNSTGRLTIYWQSANWLLEHELVARTDDGGWHVVLTGKGRTVAEEAGIS